MLLQTSFSSTVWKSVLEFRISCKSVNGVHKCVLGALAMESVNQALLIQGYVVAFYQ